MFALSNILGLLHGTVFGIANIIPGVSGGTMLVVFGCYDKVCGALALDFKEIKKNRHYLVFFAIGAALGIIGFSNVISLLFDNFPTQTYMFFIGLIIGSVPLIVRSAGIKSKDKSRPSFIIPFIIALGAVAALTALDKSMGDPSDEAAQEITFTLLLTMFFSAILAAAAMIIPGVSGSFIMVLLGAYSTIIGAVKDFNFAIIIPFGIGALIGLVFGAKLIRFLLKKYRLAVYSAILGLCVGSLYAIFPDGFGLNFETAIGFVMMLVGGALSLLVGKYTKTEE